MGAENENGNQELKKIVDPLTHNEVAGPVMALLRAVVRRQGLSPVRLRIEGLRIVITQIGREVFVQAGPAPVSMQKPFSNNSAH